MASQKQLQSDLEGVNETLEQHQGHIAQLRTALTEATESLTRARAAFEGNTSVDLIDHLNHEIGLGTVARNNAEAWLKQAESELPTLEKAVADATEALRVFNAGALTRQLQLDGPELIQARKRKSEIESRLQSAAEVAARALGLNADALYALHLAALEGDPNRLELQQLALAVYFNPGSMNDVELKNLLAVAQPGEFVRLALAGTDPLPVLRARVAKAGQAKRDQWFVDAQARLAELEQQWIAKVEAAGDEDQVKAEKFAIGEIAQGRRTAGLSLCAFEASCIGAPMPTHRRVLHYESEVYTAYCRLREMLEREQGFAENRSVASAPATNMQLGSIGSDALRYTGDGVRV